LELGLIPVRHSGGPLGLTLTLTLTPEWRTSGMGAGTVRLIRVVFNFRLVISNNSWW